MKLSGIISTTFPTLEAVGIKPTATAVSAVLKPQPTQDVAELGGALAELQTKAFERLAQKLDIQVVKEADITRFIDSFPDEDRKYAKAVLHYSEDGLSVPKFLDKMEQTPWSQCSKLEEIRQNKENPVIILDESEGAALAYLGRKWSYSSKFYLGVKLDEFEGYSPEKVFLVDKIKTKPLSKEEIESISEFKEVEFIDNSMEHGLTFFDFAADSSGDIAQEKAKKIIARAKRIKAKNPSLTEEEAVEKAMNMMRNRNIAAINTRRTDKGLPPVKILQNTPGRARHVGDLIKGTLSPDTLREYFKVYFEENPDFLKFLASDNGFTFYNPRKTFDALHDISSKILENLKKDGLTSSDVFFVNPIRQKSDIFMTYMLKKLNIFDENQFLDAKKAQEMSAKGLLKGKVVVFLDDINGTGDTVERNIKAMSNLVNADELRGYYVAHIVSLEPARENQKLAREKTTHIFHQNALSLFTPEHPIYKEIPYEGKFKKEVDDMEEFRSSYKNSGGTQAFFFNIPDNLITILNDNIRDLLGTSRSSVKLQD